MSNELVGTCDWLVAETYRSHLLERGRLDGPVADFARAQPYADAAALADFLVRQDILTPFQAERALEGEARSLVLGPYILREPVGVGSMGTVYRAVGKADRQDYAVKVLPLRSLWNVRLARKQVRAFAELSASPVVVPFVDVGTAGGKHYLVWPFVSGTTLEKAIEQCGALTWHEAARVGLRLAEGLQACHDRGVFHGLLKPSNVSLDDAGEVRLLDFGIGALLAENTDESLLDTMTTANATAGMLDCASPESILDPAKRSFAGDQYSLGCVLYYCLAGQYPFPEGNLVDKMVAHQSQAPPALGGLCPSVPADLAAIIERLMQKAPEARFRRVGDAAQELQRVTAGQRPAPLAMDTPSIGNLHDTPGVRRALPLPDLTLTPPVPRPKSAPVLPAATAPPTLPRPSESAPWIMPTGPRQSGIAPPAPLPPKSGVARLPAQPKSGLFQPPPLPPSPEPPAGKSLLGRVVEAVAFWRPRRDAVTCSVLAPPVLFVGEAATLPLFAHGESPDTILAMGRTYFPTHQLIASRALHRELARGARLTFHVALPGLTLDPPVQKFVWRGQVMPLPFTVQVPADFRLGEIVGIVSVAEGEDTILNGDFRVLIGRRA